MCATRATVAGYSIEDAEDVLADDAEEEDSLIDEEEASFDDGMGDAADDESEEI